MSNIIAVQFDKYTHEDMVYDLKVEQLRYLMRRLPEIKVRQQKLKELRAPKQILDNEVRLIACYTHRYNRLRAWWDATPKMASRLLCRCRDRSSRLFYLCNPKGESV